MEIICAPIPTFSLQTDWGIVGDETSQLCPLLIFVGVQRCCSAELWGRHVSVVLWASLAKETSVNRGTCGKQQLLGSARAQHGQAHLASSPGKLHINRHYSPLFSSKSVMIHSVHPTHSHIFLLFSQFAKVKLCCRSYQEKLYFMLFEFLYKRQVQWFKMQLIQLLQMLKGRIFSL